MYDLLSFQVKQKHGYPWLVEILYLIGQYLTIRYVHPHGPGRLARWIYQLPCMLYKIGLAGLIDSKILLLTTIGRRTGREHTVPLGYIAGVEDRSYYLIAGWGGRTDWSKNCRANPKVEIRVGSVRLRGQTRYLTVEEQTEVLENFSRQFPLVLANYERLTGRSRKDRQDLFRRAAELGPMIVVQAGQAKPDAGDR